MRAFFRHAAAATLTLSLLQASQETALSAGSWVEKGLPTKKTYELIMAIRSDSTIVCDKSRYGLGRIDRLMQRSPLDPQAREELDALFEEIDRLYRHDRGNGCLDPYTIYPDAIAIEKKEENETDSSPNILVSRLEEALAFYETIERNGGWSVIGDDFHLLKEGDTHPLVPAIKARLRVTGDYNATLDSNTTYDTVLSDAVRVFQKRHGLKPDGILGPRTLQAMNVPVSEKIEKIKINIERARWLTTGSRDFVAANIPDYTLRLFRNARPALTMKCIVGRKERPTPMLSDRLTYAVLNPFWRAPATIVEEDILPKLRAGEFDYLERVGIVVTKAADGNVTIDPRSVDWRRYTAESMAYIFLQKPGPRNYLGFVKFMFPNDFDVYIHDTPEDDLFEEKERARSSGCIRAEKPLELFHALFDPDGNGEWSYKHIVKTLLKKEERLVGLQHPLPVYILYMTVYVDEQNRTRFLKDIYGYDRQMLDYLNGHQ
ncbi:L,D-transpeptidase family protein [Hydrogenimonas urashimensis]|uniref:L,D-transpeptidase family protein n=1 Tax=Hydrogenimonas urashimensis TaxID=2740515 RepID=UPI001915282D|nr:L,D-transpeptidase family protein [Hydrogenimonas urashimensis]